MNNVDKIRKIKESRLSENAKFIKSYFDKLYIVNNRYIVNKDDNFIYFEIWKNFTGNYYIIHDTIFYYDNINCYDETKILIQKYMMDYFNIDILLSNLEYSISMEWGNMSVIKTHRNSKNGTK